MTSLQKKMAEFGYESNEDYQFQLQCFLSARHDGIPLLIIEGGQQRRKTAFANAFALAMDYPHLLYYDFSQQEAADNKIQLPDSLDEDGLKAEPVSDFDHIMSQACAYSEAEKTIVILDQLHLTDFKNHIRLYHFVRDFKWYFNQSYLQANPDKLILMLISKDQIYHSLHKSAYKIWVSDISDKAVRYQPEAFDLDQSSAAIMAALDAVFEKLAVFPTYSEYKKILDDIHHHVKNEEHLMYSIYGWSEAIQLDMLYYEAITPLLQQVVKEIHLYWGIDEVII